ncbi:MAG: glycosyltransferase family 2 protein [Opitutaceae bacterium]
MFSVVIPIGPSRDGRRALESLSASGLSSDDEVIVVGDGHVVPVEEYRLGFKVLQVNTAKPSGASAARNLGVSSSTQPFLCFLDDDDAHEDGTLRCLREMLIKDPECRTCSLSWKFDSGRKVSAARRRLPRLADGSAIARRNLFGGCSSMLVHRDTFFEAGGFDESIPCMEDWDLWLRLSKSTQIHCLNFPLIRYFDHLAPRLSTDRKARIVGLEILLKKHDANWSSSVRAFHLSRLATEYYKSGQGSWCSILQVRAPIASFLYAIRSLLG